MLPHGDLDWTGLFTGLLFLATLLLFGVGWWQITAVRRENKLERTLAACNRYESDAVIERCVRNLKDAEMTTSFEDSPKTYRHDVVVVLNYLDTIAIGIKQKLYEESLAKDHTRNIVKYWCEKYLNNKMAELLKIDVSDYGNLCDMANSWRKQDTQFCNGRRGRRAT